MYVCVLGFLAACSFCFESLALLIYLLVVALGFHLRVVLVEEPMQAREFGEAWHTYAEHTPRWLMPRSRSMA